MFNTAKGLFVLEDILKRTGIYLSPGEAMTDSQLNRFVGRQDVGRFLINKMED